MKITKSYLKQIIKEELQEADSTNDADYVLDFLKKLSAVGVGRNVDIKQEAKMAFQMMAKLHPEEAKRYLDK